MVTERIVVPIPASTEIYVVLQNKPNNRQALQHQSAKRLQLDDNGATAPIG